MLLIKPTEQMHRYITDLCIRCLFLNSLCFPEFRLFTPQQNGHKQRGWGGHNFHGNDCAAPCQAEVGRGWLAAWFLLQSLILKLSLTQQIPFSSLSSLFSPHFVRLICLSLFHLSPPPQKKSTALSVHLSARARRIEDKRCVKEGYDQINPHICFAECHQIYLQ